MSAWGASKPTALTRCAPGSDPQPKACEDDVPLRSFRNTRGDIGGTEHLLLGAAGCVKNFAVGERQERRGRRRQLFPARSPPGHAGHLNFKAHLPRLFSPPSPSSSQRPRPWEPLAHEAPMGSLVAKLLLPTISTLVFLPTISIAAKRRFHMEAMVYFFTMFFVAVRCPHPPHCMFHPPKCRCIGSLLRGGAGSRPAAASVIPEYPFSVISHRLRC